MSDSRSCMGYTDCSILEVQQQRMSNERSPRRVLVQRTRHVSMSDERSRRHPVTANTELTIFRQVRRQEIVVKNNTTATNNTLSVVCLLLQNAVGHNSADVKTSVNVVWTPPSDLSGYVEFV